MNGLLLINKPSGITSHDVVNRIRKILHTKEVGHSGTLDPLASGLMVILVGEATKLSSFVTDGDKAYQVGVRLGVTTDTLDITGQIISEKKIECEISEVKNIAQSLHGQMELPIPMYSAKKIDGKKLYEYAREGEVISRPTKSMNFWQIEDLCENKKLQFHLCCSKGSFIRSWVALLGERAGCGATMESLIRTQSHSFKLENAITLEALESLSESERLDRLISLDQALIGFKRLRVKGQDAVLMKNGQISHQLRVRLITCFDPSCDEFVQILPEQSGRLLAIIGLEKGQGFKIKRVFNYE